MICPNTICRKQNPDDNVFCEYCGTRLTTIPEPPVEEKLKSNTLKKTIVANLQDVQLVLYDVKEYFEGKGFEVYIKKTSSGGFISITKGELFKTPVELKYALNTTLNIQNGSIFVKSKLGFFKGQTEALMFATFGIAFPLVTILMKSSNLNKEMMTVIENSVIKHSNKSHKATEVLDDTHETFMDRKREDPEPYKGDKSFVFISYSHRDKERVYPIIKKLIELGVRIWFDEAIVPSVEWDEDIAKHIKNCAGMISFISETYIDSKNCIAELKYARSKNRQQLLIYLEDTELPDGIDMLLCGIQAIKIDLSVPQNIRRFYDRILECPFVDSIIKTE